MHSGSSKRAPSMPPMSMVFQPKAVRMPVTVVLAPPSLPQMNISGGPPGNCGLNMCALPTILNAFDDARLRRPALHLFTARISLTQR